MICNIQYAPSTAMRRMIDELHIKQFQDCNKKVKVNCNLSYLERTMHRAQLLKLNKSKTKSLLQEQERKC